MFLRALLFTLQILDIDMKAKLKATGEQVEVTPNGMMNISCASYKDKSGRMIPSTALEFDKEIDWEQRRYELAKAAMQGFITNNELFERFEENAEAFHDLCSDSISITDEMIKQLK